MLRRILMITGLLSSFLLQAQGVRVGENPGNPDPSAGFEVDFSDKGFLLPRLTTAQRDAISNPSPGLKIYNLDSGCENFFNGIQSTWQEVCGTCTPPPPAQPSGFTGPGLVCSGDVIQYDVNPITGATFNWSFPAGWTILSGDGTESVSVQASSSSGLVSVNASNACGSSAATSLSVTSGILPTTPTASSPSVTSQQIIWNWQSVAGATGYRISTIDQYVGSTDIGLTTSYTQSGLNCGSSYNLYVWAYSNCGSSGSLALNASTESCTELTFSYTGSNQSWTVPSGVTRIDVFAWGAGGGGSGSGCGHPSPGLGGAGGFASGSIAVIPGNNLTVIVGGGGISSGSTIGSGGGRSALLLSGTHLIVAGGGGGAGEIGHGGAGGGANGLSGTAPSGGTPGGGGSQSMGGTASGGASAGSLGTGGAGEGSIVVSGGFGGGGTGADIGGAGGGGGGGGGYYGGGGGSGGPSCNATGGGGGSGYVINTATNINNLAGSGQTPPNTGSPYYGLGIGTGGNMNASGGHGKIVIRY